LCELVGARRLNNALGIVYLCRGLGCVLGMILTTHMAGKYGSDSVYYIIVVSFSVGFVFNLLASLFQFIERYRRGENYAAMQLGDKTVDDTESQLNA
jgi:dipeptide/tripeptide permease